MYFYSIFAGDTNFKKIYEDKNFSIFKNGIQSGSLFQLPSEGRFDFDYVYTRLSNRLAPNLLKNPSFEDGMKEWILNPPSFINVSENSKQGKNAALIYGQEGWWPDFRQTIPVKGNTTYNVQAFVKGYNITDLHTKIFWFDQTQNIGDFSSVRTDFLNFGLSDMREGEWSMIDEVVQSPANSKVAQVAFLGSSLQGRYPSTSTLVDNVTFHEVSPQVTGLPSKIQVVNDYDTLAPTSYRARLDADKPITLAFDQSYDPLWEGSIFKNGRNVESVSPIPLYGTINGFRINQSGAMDIVIEYKLQGLFEIAILATFCLYVSCGAILLYQLFRTRKHRYVTGVEAYPEILYPSVSWVDGADSRPEFIDTSLFSLTSRNILAHALVLTSILLSRLILPNQNYLLIGTFYAIIMAIFVCLRLNGRIPIMYSLAILALEVVLAFYVNESVQNQLLIYFLVVVGVISSITRDFSLRKFRKKSNIRKTELPDQMDKS
jgi:hypothetical protein